MLPDEEVIGDPFWVVMGTEQDSDKNTGNYEMVNDSILLFISKKQAINYCSKIKNSAKVFGISQNPSQSVSFSSRKRDVSRFWYSFS